MSLIVKNLFYYFTVINIILLAVLHDLTLKQLYYMTYNKLCGIEYVFHKNSFECL